ncbi:MAG: sigma-54 dependent transcriptional regulator [Bacteroidales bacterium]
MSKLNGTICIVDDNRSILKTLEILLADYFRKVITISNPEQIPTLFRSERIDVALLDMNYTTGINNGNEGLYWLSQIKRTSPKTEVVLFTAYAYIDLAVSGIKNGAFDFIPKPWENEKLIETLQKAMQNGQGDAKEKKKESGKVEQGVFKGSSPAMMRLYEQIEKIASTDANVLITGENGTGKEVFARQIHALSRRKENELVTVDMGALTETLFESELFGHVKGAFTDAKADRPGKFEAASQGSLFLDEIGNLPFHLQAKLLSVLQQRKVTRVGSNSPREVDIRLICATNCNLPDMVRQGRFREDLFYRINTITLEIPPLRNRKEDLIPMAEMFVARYAKMYDRENMTLDRSAIEKIKSYSWPGNVRELQHTIERAVIMGNNVLAEGDFCFQDAAMVEDDQNMTLEEMEKTAIANAIRNCEGNLSLVAQQLGITRQTLYNKIKKYNLL